MVGHIGSLRERERYGREREGEVYMVVRFVWSAWLSFESVSEFSVADSCATPRVA